MTLTTSLHKKLTFIFSLAVSAFLFIVLTQTSHAATINVVAGTDAIDANGQCQLSEAIQNINDQAQTNTDCPAGDGNDDTINLPSGTVESGGTIHLGHSVTFQGQGIDSSVISGASFTDGNTSSSDTLTFSGITFTSWSDLLLNTSISNLVLENTEVDGSSANVGSGGAFIIGNSDGEGPALNTITINNLHIHDVTADDSYIHMLDIWTRNNNSLTVNINNLTVNNISNTGGGVNIMPIGVGAYNFDHSAGSFDASINNVTIDNISADGGIATITAVSVATLSEGIADTNVVLNNATITNISSGPSIFGFGGTFGATGAALSPLETANLSFDIRNTILQNNVLSSQPASCYISDIGSLLGATSTPNLAVTSLGGNISDDTSCASSFTDPTDQNNVDAADLQLGTLGDYGGSVPTIPLGQGSIAIDAGVTVPGLTTDARGVSRPQCSAYDAGAYEYNGTCPTPPSAQPLTTTVSNNTTSYLILPSGISNPSFTTTPPSSISSDPSFTYPSGLVSFQFDTEPGSTETITLYFDLPGDPTDYLARKYNTTTKAFTTIQGATITRTTYNNKSMLKLTYDITDGGDLDQDGTTNGTIVDPVGLAQTTTTAPDTGVPTYWLMRVKG